MFCRIGAIRSPTRVEIMLRKIEEDDDRRVVIVPLVDQ